MWTMTKSKLMYVCAVSLMLGAPSGGWANNLSTEKVGDTGSTHEVASCETEGAPIARAAEVVAQATSPGGQPRDTLRIVSVDPVQGKVTAQSTTTGKTLHYVLRPEALRRHKLSVGRTVAFEAMVGIAKLDGNCEPCGGQHRDGTCICNCNVPGCQASCDLGECGKVKGGDGKITIETPGGGGYRP